MQDLTEEIGKTIDVLLKTEKSLRVKQKFLDKGKTVYLQIALFKAPFVPSRKRKFLRLCHSLYGDDPEICLFVPNRKTGVEYKKTTEELIDFCVDYYTDILEKHKVKGITTIMPLKQLKSEYGTFELRKKLVHRFDLFLCKNSLFYNERFLKGLGKIFRVANKEPLGVPFPKEDVKYDPEFQKNIERAIYTSSFYINPFSDNYSIPFGSLSNTKLELEENLKAVLDQLSNKEIIPGGFQNIRALYLWPSQSKPVPLYISSELPVNMKMPRLKMKRKRVRGVEGELSTLPNKKVFVGRNGDVFVTKLNTKKIEEAYESEDEESFHDESDCEDDVGKENSKKKDNSKTNTKGIGNKDESESENDSEIEEKESRLLEMKRRTELNSDKKSSPEKNSKEMIKKNKKVKVKNVKNGGIEIKKKKRNSKSEENGKIGKKVKGKMEIKGGNNNRKKNSKEKKVKK